MLRALRESVARGGTGALALVFALAFAAFYVADAIAGVVVYALAQQSRDDTLAFHIGDTLVSYDNLLRVVLAVLFLGFALWALWRVESRILRACPACRSEIPVDATVCRYCSTELD